MHPEKSSGPEKGAKNIGNPCVEGIHANPGRAPGRQRRLFSLHPARGLEPQPRASKISAVLHY